MTPNSANAGRRQPKKTGAHRRRRKHHSVLTRTVAAGGAAICIGAAYDLSTPTADALSILIPGRTVDGVGNTTRINIFEGNIFMPQLGLGGNVSNNSTVGNVAIGNGNDIISQLLNFEIRLGGAVGNGNTTQINLFSYNIFNPQWSLLGGNLSNNTSIGNVAMNNGNNSSAATSVGSLFPWLGGPAGNGNTFQFAFFSGNIFNPQYSLLGNVSNNTTVTNAAINNGNYSRTAATSVAVMTSLLGGTTGNGNTFQLAFFVSNIFNPQYSFGGGNTSNNSATTNTASGNGNNSTTTTSGGTSVGGTTGNGNTTQVEGGSGNIYNDQVNVGVNLLRSTGTASSNQQQSLALNTDSSNSLNSTGSRSSATSPVSSTSTASDTQQRSPDPDPVSSSTSNTSNSTTSGSASLSFAPKVSDTSAPSTSSTNDTGSAGSAGGDAGTSGGSGDGGGSGGGV